ncbi:helix-turn-helix domain-containing protein [Ramlibacter sp. AN1133]|uniref:helix-turn-helix domain-containing protein n=1 Tax=Ramlibacter sp. AN1133 TaxID=3133429 RepID=UPI0030BA7762
MNVAALPLGRSPIARCPAYRADDPCLPCTLASIGTAIGPVPAPRRRLQRGETLFREGDACRSLYGVRSGTFKAVVATPDAGEQVTGFQLSGELLGLDGLAEDRHASSAVALEDSEVIVLAHGGPPREETRELYAALPRLLARELVRKQKLAVLLSCMSAEQRLASFLLNLSHRLHARGYSATEFHLRMTRREIGSYLGVKLETVSRTFADLQRRGLLRIDGRSVVLPNRRALVRLFDELPLRQPAALRETALHA